MLNKKVIAGLLCCLPAAANANNFSYNFFEVFTAMNPSMTGVELATQVGENVHLVGRLSSQFESDFGVAGGIGFNGPINQFMDVYGQLLIHHNNFPKEDNVSSVTQAEMNIGLRVWLMNQLEATARLGKNDESSVFHAGVRFHSTDQLSLSAEARNNGFYGPK